MDSSNLSQSPVKVMKTTNRSEALHNLDKEQAMQTNIIKEQNHKPNATIQEQRAKKSISLRTNKEEILPVFNILVLVKGCVFSSTHPKALKL
jgi:hypothetical protein